jgi:hypothetical protein
MVTMNNVITERGYDLSGRNTNLEQGNRFDYTQLESVMATSSHHRTSDKYNFVPTVKLIELLEKNGWFVSSGRETNAREGRKGYQKHMLRFRKKDDVGRALKLDEVIPEILLTNAHDGGAAFKMMSALWRCWCSNGCVTADSTVADHRILHKGYTEDKVMDAVYHIVEDTPKVIESVNRFQNISLTESEQRVFGESALQVLYPEDDKFLKFHMQESVNRLIKPQRSQDKDSNLWNTYNVVQEKFLKGGRFMVEKADVEWNTDNPHWARAKKTKEIKAIDKDVKLNRALWTLTEKMAELKNA